MSHARLLSNDPPRAVRRVRRWLADLRQDGRLTVRQMRRAPGMTTLIVLTLAVGIGANVTLVGAIRQLLLRAPEYVREPERVVRLLLDSRDGRGGGAVTSAANYPMLLDVQREATAFAAVAGFTWRQMSIGIGPDAADVRAALVSADFFPLLGAAPVLGRTFSAADGYPAGETTGGPPLAVLGHGFWQRHYGRDSGVVGRAIRIGAIVYSVVGVMPAGFRGVESDAPDVWLPITVAADDPGVYITLPDRARYALSMVARLHPAATPALAEQQAAAIWQRGLRAMVGGETRDTPVRVVAASLIRGRGPDAPREVKVTLWLAGVSVFVLLITCANVANLLLGRAVARRHEVAVRLALGAGRGRLARQMLAEGVLLAAVSGAAALCVAAFGGPFLSRLLVGDAAGRFVDPGLFAFAAAIALGTGVVISLAPMLQSVRGEQITDLRVGVSSGSPWNARVRLGLLVTQSALCMALLVGAGLFALSLKRVAALDLGLDVEHTLRALVNLDRLLLPDDAVGATYDEMLRRVRAIPGVAGAALANSDPYAGGRAVGPYTPRHDADFFWPPTVAHVAMEAAVGDGFFRAVGATSLRGRDFERTDRRGAPRVAVINAPLARILYPGEDALGQCIVLPVAGDDRSRSCVTIVGVLSGVWYGTMLNREKPMVYVPLAQRISSAGVFRPQGIFVRARGEPRPIVEEIRRALQSVRSDLPAVRVTLTRDAVAAEMRPWRLGATMFGLFGAVALVVAVVGLYGIVAFAVAQRSFELAVRLALGARRRDILRAVAGEGLGAVAVGLAIGAAGALSVRRWVGPLLYQTSANDPRVMLAIAALLFGVGFVAILLPTARAWRLDSAALLRTS
ncbi:MAG: ADOP family duplicated permease [Gemmatimonadaceae bacterium]